MAVTFLKVLFFFVVFATIAYLLLFFQPGCFTPKSEEPIPINLNDPEWEAVVWLNTKHTRPHGMAVRLKKVKGAIRRPFESGAITPWGTCDDWSPESRGYYCLILECDLSAKGKIPYRKYTHREIFNVLP